MATLGGTGDNRMEGEVSVRSVECAACDAPSDVYVRGVLYCASCALTQHRAYLEGGGDADGWEPAGQTRYQRRSGYLPRLGDSAFGVNSSLRQRFQSDEGR